MQFCDLEDLYKKFNVVKMLRIGSTERPRFTYSGDFTFPESEGDILYEKSRFASNEINAPTELQRKDTELSVDNLIYTHNSNANAKSQQLADMDEKRSILDVSGSELTSQQSSAINNKDSSVAIDITSEDFQGPLTRCIEEEDDILTDDLRYVPNNITIRVKVFLPNKHPIFLILRQDATVQDAIEKTIRKSNALSAAFQKRYQELKKEEEANSPEPAEAVTEGTEEESLRHDSIDGLSEFLEHEDLRPSRRRDQQVEESEIVNGVKVDDLVGAHCITLLEDSMAYELRLEIEDGECDMDFPALERGGVLLNFYDEQDQNFCLVQVPDYVPRSTTTPMSADERVDIQLMFDDDVFTIDVPAMSTCRQLLNVARHRLVPGRIYELTVSPEDKERLKMVSEVVNENVCLNDLDVTSFRIRLKRFYDGPRVTACPTYSYNTEGKKYDHSVDLTTYIFTNFEAGKYKEWMVWKFTSKGKKRKRVFAIDCDEVYIYHSASLKQCRGCGAGNQTYIFISNILDVQLDDRNPEFFILYYQDDESDSEGDIANTQRRQVKFQAMSVEDSYDIVNRIHHLMRNYQ